MTAIVHVSSYSCICTDPFLLLSTHGIVTIAVSMTLLKYAE